MGTGTFGMNHPFGDSIPVEMRQLFDQMDILQQDGAPLAGREGVLVISNRNTLICGKSFLDMGCHNRSMGKRMLLT